MKLLFRFLFSCIAHSYQTSQVVPRLLQENNGVQASRGRWKAERKTLSTATSCSYISCTISAQDRINFWNIPVKLVEAKKRLNKNKWETVQMCERNTKRKENTDIFSVSLKETRDAITGLDTVCPSSLMNPCRLTGFLVLWHADSSSTFLSWPAEPEVEWLAVTSLHQSNFIQLLYNYSGNNTASHWSSYVILC